MTRFISISIAFPEANPSKSKDQAVLQCWCFVFVNSPSLRMMTWETIAPDKREILASSTSETDNLIWVRSSAIPTWSSDVVYCNSRRCASWTFGSIRTPLLVFHSTLCVIVPLNNFQREELANRCTCSSSASCSDLSNCPTVVADHRRPFPPFRTGYHARRGATLPMKRPPMKSWSLASQFRMIFSLSSLVEIISPQKGRSTAT